MLQFLTRQISLGDAQDNLIMSWHYLNRFWFLFPAARRELDDVWWTKPIGINARPAGSRSAFKWEWTRMVRMGITNCIIISIFQLALMNRNMFNWSLTGPQKPVYTCPRFHLHFNPFPRQKPSGRAFAFASASASAPASSFWGGSPPVEGAPYLHIAHPIDLLPAARVVFDRFYAALALPLQWTPIVHFDWKFSSLFWWLVRFLEK